MVKDRMRRDHPGEEDEYRRVWERMWHILSSVALTTYGLNETEQRFSKRPFLSNAASRNSGIPA